MVDVAMGDVGTEVCGDSSEKERGTLLVQDLNPSTTEECVRYYFENRRRSGGGPVSTVQRLDHTSVLVTFVLHAHTDSVLGKTQHKLDGSILRVSALHSRQGHQSGDCGVSTDTNITPDSQSPTALDNVTKSSEISENRESSTAVVKNARQSSENSKDLKFDFPKSSEFSVTGKTIPNLNYSQLKFLCSRRVRHQLQKQFAGVDIFINENTQSAFVKASEDVLNHRFFDLHLLISSVTKTSVGLSPAMMKMYDNQDHVNWIQTSVIDQTGLLCHWDLCDRHLVIYAPQSSLSVLAHLFKSVFIELDFYLEDRDVGLLRSPAWTMAVSELKGDSCPSPVVFIEGDSVTIVDIPTHIKHTHSVVRQFLDKNRAFRGQVISVSSGDESGAGQVISVSSGDESGVAESPLVCHGTEDAFSNFQTSSVSDIPEESFSSLRSGCVPYIPENAFSNFQPKSVPCVVEDTISNVQPSCVASMVEDVIPNLKPRQLKVLSCAGCVDHVVSKYTGVAVCVDVDSKRALLTAPLPLMKKVKTDMLYFLNLIRQVQVPLSAAVRRMFERDGVREWVQSALCDSGHQSCVWEMCGDHIVISGPSSHILGFEQRLKSLFTKITVHLEEWELHVLSPSVWSSFVDGHHRRSGQGVSPVLQLVGDRVTIVHAADDGDSIRLSLRQLLDEHRVVMHALLKESSSSLLTSSVCIIEKCIPHMTAPQLKIVSHPKTVARLVKQHAGLVLSVDHHTHTVRVRAPDTVMDKAFPSVACFLSLIQESRVPLTAGLCEMWSVEGSRDWVQVSLVDRYDLVCHWELVNQSLVVHGHSRDIQRLVQMFKSVFKERRVDLTQDQVTVLTSEWSSFLHSLDKEPATGPSPVLQLHSCCVLIVGIPSRIDSCQVTLQTFLKKHEKSVDVLTNATPCTSQLSSGSTQETSVSSVHETSTTNTHQILVSKNSHENFVPSGPKHIPNIPEKSIPNLTTAQIKVLSCSRAMSTFNKMYPGLQIIVDRDKMAATIRAPESVVLKALTELIHFIKEVREVKVALSPPLFEMFEKEDSKAWVQQTLIDKYDLVCHWETCDLHLLISAHSSNLFRLERLFQSIFKETDIGLQLWEAGLLTPSLWTSYVTELHKDREGIPAPVLNFDTSADVITIVDIVSKVDDTKQSLRQLLDDLIIK